MATNNALNNSLPSGFDSTGTTSINATGSATTSIGSSAAGALSLASGSNSTITITNATLTTNSGTGTIGLSTDSTNTTCDFATGGAAKVVTLGSTNTTGSLALQFGTADFSAASATGNIIVALDTGEITKPLQSAWSAYNSVTDTNQTGLNTTPTVQEDTEVFDIGSHFASNTWTASVTGKYQLSYSVCFGNIVAATSAYPVFSTSNRGYTGVGGSPTAKKNQDVFNYWTLSVLADMDAADTAKVTLNVTGEATNRISILGTTNPLTYFTGVLIC